VVPGALREAAAVAVAAQGVGLSLAAQPVVAVVPGAVRLSAGVEVEPPVVMPSAVAAQELLDAAQEPTLAVLHVAVQWSVAHRAGPALTALTLAVEPSMVESSAVAAQELSHAARGRTLAAVHVEAPRLAAQVVPDADGTEVATLAALA
jgi:hypothetical protein